MSELGHMNLAQLIDDPLFLFASLPSSMKSMFKGRWHHSVRDLGMNLNLLLRILFWTLLFWHLWPSLLLLNTQGHTILALVCPSPEVHTLQGLS